ncbi:MAG: uroporphyrinogen decarboxylase family protein [Terriglobia bacterium]
MKSLTSRDRVIAALNHEKADRVPIDFGGSRVTGIAAVAYRRLLEHLGVPEDVHLYDLKQQLADPSLAMIERMGGDVVQLHRLAPTTGMPFLFVDCWKTGCMTDGAPCLVPEAYESRQLAEGVIEIIHQGEVIARRPTTGLYFDACHAPLANAETPADIDRFVFPDPWTQREEQYIKARVKQLYDGTDKAIFAGLPLMNCSFLEISLMLFGYERFMEHLVLNRELIEHWLSRMLENDIRILERFLVIAGPYIQTIQLNDDFGAQDSLQISPKIYREVFKPYQKKWIDFVKARTGAKVFIHCDGAIEAIIADFIEIGIDVLNPLQTTAKGMDPQRIKNLYGDRLSFWGGGVETQTTLPFGTIDDIRREVSQRIALLGKGGGYVFGTIHNIQPDIPPETILAVFDTARQCAANL